MTERTVDTQRPDSTESTVRFEGDNDAKSPYWKIETANLRAPWKLIEPRAVIVPWAANETGQPESTEDPDWVDDNDSIELGERPSVFESTDERERPYPANRAERDEGSVQKKRKEFRCQT